MMEPEQTIIIAGGTGLVGQRLVALLRSLDYKVFILTRNKKLSSTPGYLLWDPTTEKIFNQLPQDCHAIVNLAGAGIVDRSWTEKYKQIILQSRVDSNKTLANVLDHYQGGPAFISASAIGFYGDRKEPGQFYEKDRPATGGFLQYIARQWEAAAAAAGGFSRRHVTLRIGIVLSSAGGALTEMKKGFQLGIGSYVAPGDQYYSWIHILDLCRIIRLAVESEDMHGTFNAVAPEPVTAKQLAVLMSQQLYGSKKVIPIPGLALRLTLGQRREVLQENCPVAADKIVKAGFSFQFPTCKQALSDLLNSEN